MKVLQFVILFSLFFVFRLSGQPQLTIDRTKMLIGDQAALTLSFKMPGTAEWGNPDIQLPDTLTSIQTIQSLDPVINGNTGEQQVVKQWTIAPFDTGYIYIPSLPVVIMQNGQSDTFFTNNIPINVQGVTADSTGLAPIKDIIEEPKNWIDYLWLFIIIGVAGLLYAAFRLMKKRNEAKPELPEIIRPAHEIALEKLDVLDAARLWQKGEIKAYHVELTHIFREYLEKRYHIPALESTTEEISLGLKKVGLEQHERSQVRELLLQSDLVKFAKAKPRVEVHDELMHYARAFILRTKFEASHHQEEEEE